MNDRVLPNNKIVYLFAGLISILLSVAGVMRAEVVNPDGICYLQSAASFGQTDLHTTMHICGQAQWPFYSILIFAVAALTHFSYVTAAFSLNGLLSLVSVFSFIYLIHLLGGNKRVLIIAAAVILFAHEFDSVREYVIRDHGYWAFYLLSMIFLLHFFRERRHYYGLLWSLSILIAALFRIEGVIFLVLMPFIALVQPAASLFERLKLLFTLNVLTLLLAICVVADMHSLIHLERINQLLFQVHHGFQVIVQHFNHASGVLSQQILSVYSARDANVLLVLFFIIWYVWAVATNLTFLYSALLFYALSKNLLRADSSAKSMLCGYACINFLITSLFLLEYMFLSKRYLIALSLTLTVFVPFAIDHLLQLRGKNKLIVPGLIVVFLVSSLGGIFDFGYSKSYIKDAGHWLAERVPPNAKIYSNDEQVMYYSNHFGNDIFAKSSQFSSGQILANQQQRRNFDYLAIRINQNQPTDSIFKNIPLKPLQVFQNNRGDKVVIYRTQEKSL